MIKHTVPRMPRFKKVECWLECVQNENSEVQGKLREIYGDDRKLISERSSIITKALRDFGDVYGYDREVIISRAPCRINLRGMHSEIQRATPNYLTHSREMVIVAGKRDDDLVLLNNVENDRFGERQFSIPEEIDRGQWGNWDDYIDSQGVREYIDSHRGDWSNYIKASVLKIQDTFPDRRLNGMDVMAYGDVPCGNGMSSSSALVVSAGLAMMAVNELAMEPSELAIGLAHGEWYVGTRGGFGDHGAMIFGKRGHILHSMFLTVDEVQPKYIPFPSDHQVAIINSYKTSNKSADHLFAYNQTIFAYSIAMPLVKDVLKSKGLCLGDLVSQINYLGQINTSSIELRKIYGILRCLPERISIADLRSRYGDIEIDKRLDRFFGQLGKYPKSVSVRGPVLWGIAESERSRRFAELVEAGDMTSAGELMYIGHDGDRVFSSETNSDFTSNRVTNGYLDRLIENLKSDDQGRIHSAELARQPGDFGSSSYELDRIVDIARGIDGVKGASLTGAGFGGNVLAIMDVDDRVLGELRESLFDEYYSPHELDELEWFDTDPSLALAFGGENELRDVRSRIRDLVYKKQKTKSGMPQEDVIFAESIRRRVNRLFRDGKISRETLLIPADYCQDGIVKNVTVDCAEVL